NQRDASEERTVPVELRGVPLGARYEAVPPDVTLQLRGPRRLLVGLAAADLHARADVTASGDLPVLGVAPPGVEVAAGVPTHRTAFERRDLRIEPVLGFHARVIRVEPPTVTVLGRPGAFKGVDSLKTQPVTLPAPTVRAQLAPRDGLELADPSRTTVDVLLD